MKPIKLHVAILTCFYIGTMHPTEVQRKTEYYNIGAFSTVAFCLGFGISKLLAVPEQPQQDLNVKNAYPWSLPELKKSLQEELVLINELMALKQSVYFDDEDYKRADARIQKIDELIGKEEITPQEMHSVIVNIHEQKRRLGHLKAKISKLRLQAIVDANKLRVK